MNKLLQKNHNILTDDLIKEGSSYTDHSFNSDQAAVIEEDLKYCSKWLLIDESVISEICRNALIPSRSNDIRLVYQIFDEHFINKFNNYNNAYKDTLRQIRQTTNDDPFSQEIKSKYFMFAVNDGIMYNFINLYSQFMFDSLITDQEIQLGKLKLDVEHMRNSLVHSRWHCGARGKIHFYDWENGDKNELMPNWKASLKFNDLLKIVDDQYLKLKENEKVVSDYPIHFRKNKQVVPHKIEDVTFVRDSKGYMYVVNDESLAKYNAEKGLYVSEGGAYKLTKDLKDLQMFLTEMENLTEEEKEQNSQLIEQIKQHIDDTINNLSRLEID